MPKGITIDEVKAEMFGIEGTLPDDELHVASNMVLVTMYQMKSHLQLWILKLQTPLKNNCCYCSKPNNYTQRNSYL